MARIGVIGVGSIGATLARGFDRLGHDVRINDKDGDREAALDFPAWPRTRMASQCTVVIVAVPTPTTEYGGDYSAVDEVLRSFDRDDRAVVCLRSTMPPGSTARLTAKHDLGLVYSPEFLRDRSGVEDFFDPDRIVLAGPDEQRATVREVVDDARIDCDQFIETQDYLTAELGKEAHNAFFATKVSFANQMRAIAEQEGADAEMVMDIVTADGRNTSSHLDPMLGPFGGKCLPKDLAALRHYASEQQDCPTPLLDGTKRMNDIAKDEYEYLDIEGNWPNVSIKGD